MSNQIRQYVDAVSMTKKEVLGAWGLLYMFTALFVIAVEQNVDVFQSWPIDSAMNASAVMLVFNIPLLGGLAFVAYRKGRRKIKSIIRRAGISHDVLEVGLICVGVYAVTSVLVLAYAAGFAMEQSFRWSGVVLIAVLGIMPLMTLAAASYRIGAANYIDGR